VTLILYYLAFIIGGDLAAYFLGLLVEYAWGKHVSMIVFLALYFSVLWVSWVLAVWLTTPRDATPSASRAPEVVDLVRAAGDQAAALDVGHDQMRRPRPPIGQPGVYS
jgi:hypothetical protein